jgi:1,4-dihydroxy-2-naphthoate octaprenyltransferase
LGDIAVALGFGPVIVLGTEYVAARQLTGEALYVSVPIGLLTALILYVNQVPDRHADAVAGKRTLAVRWSQAAVIAGYDMVVGVALGLILVGAFANAIPMGTILALGAAPLALRVHRSLWADYDRPYTLMGAMGRNIGFHAVAGLGLIAGYVLEIIV